MSEIKEFKDVLEGEHFVIGTSNTMIKLNNVNKWIGTWSIWYQDDRGNHI